MPWSFWSYRSCKAGLPHWYLLLISCQARQIRAADAYRNAGFLTKVKKILECVCFHCSKLKVDDVRFAVTKTSN